MNMDTTGVSDSPQLGVQETQTEQTSQLSLCVTTEPPKNETRTNNVATSTLARPAGLTLDSPSAATISPVPWSADLVQARRMNPIGPPAILEAITDMANKILLNASKRVKTVLKKTTLQQEKFSQYLINLTTKYRITEQKLNAEAFDHIFYKMMKMKYNVTSDNTDRIIENLKQQNQEFANFCNDHPLQARSYVQTSSPLTFDPKHTAVIYKIAFKTDQQVLKILVSLRELHHAYSAARKSQKSKTREEKAEDFSKIYEEPDFLQWCAIIHQSVFRRLAQL